MVQCRVCIAGVPPERRKWIQAQTVERSHLKSPTHLRALELAEEAQRRLENLQKERDADSATSALRDVHFTTQRAQGPLAAASSRVISEEESEMWADYRVNGAEFSAGDDVEDPQAKYGQLREEAKCFGLWNPDTTAKRLGFGVGEGAEVLEDYNEDDYLGEIMRDAGECWWEGKQWKMGEEWFVSIT